MRSASISMTVPSCSLEMRWRVGGHVLAGEGVVLAAEPGDDLGELADRDLVGRLEHQVLEEVGDAGHALGLVGGADLVPDHVRDDGGAVVGDDDHLHAVGELELAGTRLGAGRDDLLSECEHCDCHRKGCRRKGRKAAEAEHQHQSNPDQISAWCTRHILHSLPLTAVAKDRHSYRRGRNRAVPASTHISGLDPALSNDNVFICCRAASAAAPPPFASRARRLNSTRTSPYPWARKPAPGDGAGPAGAQDVDLPQQDFRRRSEPGFSDGRF